MSIRCISFDLDDTLWAVAPVIFRAEQRLHAWLEKNHQALASRYSIEAFRELRKALMLSDPQLRVDLSELRKRSLRIAARAVGLSSELAEPAFEVFHEARNQVVPYPDVAERLSKLAAQYPLIAISNGNAEIHRTVLGHYFRFGVSAEQVGVAKPDPSIFRHACARLAIEPEQLLHIGDDWDSDIDGAVAAGVPCVWLNRKGHPRPARHPQVPQVFDLQELGAILHKDFGL